MAAREKTQNPVLQIRGLSQEVRQKFAFYCVATMKNHAEAFASLLDTEQINSLMHELGVDKLD